MRISPPIALSPMMNETLPARAACLDRAKPVESPSSSIVIASKAVSRILWFFAASSSVSNVSAEPVIRTPPLSFGNAAFSGIRSGTQSGKTALTDSTTFVASSCGCTTVDTLTSGAIPSRRGCLT
uniref:Uncharacterized protein n=1 Tax=uncultured marine group II/III euryarchaeote AD1000_44_D07 TaxID=1457775 RepID=A0A075FSE8_9EURY|nr:hypothetical protein [uncultured marine group II/III euryarchaeote AD1000_44_D07]